MAENILSLRGIQKSFGGVHALKGVDLQVKKGEVHCLAGENGSGKSTIIKIISGVYQMDAGEIEIDGKKYSSINPSLSIEAGIQIIYQDFSVFPNLTVMENLAINRILASKDKFINRQKIRRIAEKAVKKINFDVDLDALVGTLPVADKQLIAISRALLDDAKLIIMDEPTTALTKKEINRLFEIVNGLKSEGVTILFVSHKLDEVFNFSDSITILRNGKNVISCSTSEMTEEKFAYYMTGRTFGDDPIVKDSKPQEVIFDIENLSAPGFEKVSFKLRKGETLGITGQLGSGRTELSLALSGLLKPIGGKILLENKEVVINSASKAQKLGIVLVPEDRLTEGLFLPQPIKRNIVATNIDKLSGKFGILNQDVLNTESQNWVDKLEIATKNHEFPAQTLSGGNQQKVVLARCLAVNPKVLILNGPTVGVDIGAKHDIHKLLRKLVKEGMGIIVVSDDMAELIEVCDRVMVMQNGKVTAEISGDNLNVSNLSKYI